MSSLLTPAIRADLGGRWLLDRRVLVAIVPPALLTSVLTRDPADARTTLAWVGVNLASLMLVWLWVEVLRATAVRRRTLRATPLHLVILVGASIGFVKATTTSLFAWTAGLVPLLMPAAEWWRALSTTAQGMFLVPALTLAAAALDRYRDEYDRLVAERARTALVRDGDARETPAEVERSAHIAGFVEEARRRLSTAEERTVSSVLERLVEERLRPMTRELWAPDRIGTDFRVPSLVRSGLVANPFPIVPVALVYGLTAFASRAQEIDLAVNVVRTGATVLIIAAIFALARRLRPASPRLASLHLAATVLTTAALQTFVVESIVTDAPRWRTPTLLVTIAVWIAVLTVLSGATVVALRGGDRMREELRRSIEHDASGLTVERASQRLRDREVADHLHSSLQNRLIAAAHRIAASGEHESVVREELDAIELLLADLAAGAIGDRAVGDGARAQFADIVARWDGFVTIASRLDPVIDQLDATVQDRVAQVLVEAVNNAVRHGRAANVDVRLVRTADPAALSLTVDDDGVGPVLRPPGLGSRLFDAVSGGDWDLGGRPEGGSRLRMTIRTDALDH